MKYLSISAVLLSLLLVAGCSSEAETRVSAAPPDSGDAAGATAAAGGGEGERWYQKVSDAGSHTALYKSPSDERHYRYLELENGMQVVLISDPEADKAAASLSVNVGSFENPAEREGLAHFLEHMLFLGTDRFPEPGEYQQFLSEHGGRFNAYTSLEETNYFFDVDADYLTQVLDRFSRFFVAPLFNEEYVDRERHAVDSEYHLKIKDDSRREWDVLRELANPEHPFSLFSVGSLDTLANTADNPVRPDLIDFYNTYYSASLMNLAVLGNESLDELEAVVRERFAPVPSHDISLEETNTPLFASPLPLEVSIVPEKEMRALSFNFPMPSLNDHWRLKPGEFIGHLLGHEGEGSLLAELKERGLAEGLSSGQVFDSRHGALFSVRIQLTPAGVAQRELVTKAFFQWLDLVKSEGLDPWRYREVARMSEIDFQFAETVPASGYVSRLSTALHHYPAAEVMRGPHWFGPFDAGRMAELVGYLSADNVAVVLTAPDVETDRATALYQAPYAVRQVDVADLTADGSDMALTLPAKNPYVPEDLALLPGDDSDDVPRQLPGESAIWYDAHNPFGTPKAYVEARIALPGEITLEEDVARDFILALVGDQLSAEVYPARLAGLGFALDPWARGLQITINGYNEKQPLLLQRILEVLQAPDWRPERVARVRASLVRRWRNTAREWPLRQLFNRFPSLVRKDWTAAEKADTLANLDLEKVQAVHKAMLTQSALRVYGAGNITADSLTAMAGQVAAAFGSSPDTSVAPVAIRNLKPAQPLSASDYYVDHKDTAAALYLQGSRDDLRERALMSLLNVMVSAPFYTSLRTEKQLGYAVGSNAVPLLRVPGLLYFVQSPKVTSAELREEINSFFIDFADTAAQTSQQDLDRYRQSVLASVEKKPENLDEQAQRHLESLNLGYDSFDFRDQLVAALNDITLEEFVAAYKRLMLGERAGFWLLTSEDQAVGEGRALPAPLLEDDFSYSVQ